MNFLQTIKELWNEHFCSKNYTVYDNVITLGYNCETSFQYKLHYDYVESHLFSWCFVIETEKLIQALTHLDELGLDFEPSKPLWKCPKFNIRFHGRGSHEIWEEGAPKNALKEDKRELLSRVKYHKTKLRRVIAEQGKKLFVYMVPLPELQQPEKTAERIIRLYNAIHSMGTDDFDLVIVVTEESKRAILSYMKKYDRRSLFVYGVKFYSPNGSITKGPYDREGWKKIWNLHRPKNIQKDPNKKFKFEQ